MKRVFITGSTGFIGQHLIRRMMNNDYELTCLVRNTSNVQLHKQLGVKMVFGDVADRTSILKGMQGCDWVINLANLYSFWLPDKSVYSKVNITGTQNVMECSLETKVSKVVHISTVLTYGTPSDRPFTEDSQPGSAYSEYASTKRQGDLIAWKLYKEKGLPLVMVYPTGVIGPGDTKATFQVTQNLVKRRMPVTVFNDSILCFSHVKDVVEVIVRAAEKEGNLGEKYLVGGEQISLGEYYKTVCEAVDVPLPSLAMPDWMVMFNAAFLTALSNLTKIPPWLGMSTDQMRTMKEGFVCDGSKAERELGITYTPIRPALREAAAEAKRR